MDFKQNILQKGEGISPRYFNAMEIFIENSKLKNLTAFADQLEYRTQSFLEALCNAGIPVIDTSIATSMGDSDKQHSTYVTVTMSGYVVEATLTVQGKDIAFIEFGAGIFYNGANEHPKASEMGMGVGTYPGQTHAFDVGWWYIGEDGQKHYSHGTEARYPLYNAKQTMVSRFFEIAKEYF